MTLQKWNAIYIIVIFLLKITWWICDICAILYKNIDIISIWREFCSIGFDMFSIWRDFFFRCDRNDIFFRCDWKSTWRKFDRFTFSYANQSVTANRLGSLLIITSGPFKQINFLSGQLQRASFSEQHLLIYVRVYIIRVSVEERNDNPDRQETTILTDTNLGDFLSDCLREYLSSVKGP